MEIHTASPEPESRVARALLREFVEDPAPGVWGVTYYSSFDEKHRRTTSFVRVGDSEELAGYLRLYTDGSYVIRVNDDDAPVYPQHSVVCSGTPNGKEDRQ